MSDFLFNGVSADSMGLRIERYPVIHKPRKRLEPVSVMGRNGNLHICDGSYESIVIRYECWWKNANLNFSTARTAHEVAEWLYNAPVAARLEDTYDSAVFRTATFHGPLDIENILDRYGRVTLEFECRPEAWLKSAEKALTFTNSGGLVNNSTPFPTKPLVRIVGSVGGLLKIGESFMVLRFPGTDTHEFWLDCEEQEAWEVVDGQEVPSNAIIDDYNFLRIAPGTSKIEFPSGWDSVTVWTRGYTL